MRTSIAASYTHRIELGGDTEFVNQDNFQDVCDRLVAKHGGAQPTVTSLKAIPAAVADRLSDGSDISFPDSLPKIVKPGEIDEVGRVRSQAARFEMQANGFLPKQPIYAVGSRVNETGVENAQASRLEYDALPLVSESCARLQRVVAAEQRRDVPVKRLAEVRMRDNGRLYENEDRAGLPITEAAFGGFLTRSGINGHAYLSKCPPELRAHNVNHWMSELKFNERQAEIEALAAKRSWEPQGMTLRTRLNDGEREIFAAVSPTYQAFDVDKIAAAVALAAPDSARGSIVYDGTRAKFENLFHSNIAPSEYVAGEFFKAGVLIRTDDTGGGSIRVSAVVWQNLCLNLIVLDECEQQIAAIRHVGSVEKLAKKFRDAFTLALGSISGFLAKWDVALKDDVLTAHDFAGHQDIASLPISKALPGLFNGIIERELVTVGGPRKEAVQGLVRMFEKDTSAARVGKDYITRAAVVNAFTRYAHEVNTDPFQQDAIERSAGSLLAVTRSNKVLPFEPIDF